MRKVTLEPPPLSKAEWECFAELYASDAVVNEESVLMNDAAAAGTAGHLQRELFIKIACWKSSRPRPHYESNSEQEVIDVTRLAFSLPGVTDPIIELTRLSGVRVRTATAILHLCLPERFPLLDFRAMTALGVPEKDTGLWDDLDWLRVWKPYTTLCLKLAERHHLSLRTIDRGLYSIGRLISKRLASNEKIDLETNRFTSQPQMSAEKPDEDNDEYKRGHREARAGIDRDRTGGASIMQVTIEVIVLAVTKSRVDESKSTVESHSPLPSRITGSGFVTRRN